MAERLVFDALLNDRASPGFLKMGRAASAADDDVLALGKRLDELGRKSATARVGLQGDKEALAKLDAYDAKLLRAGRKVTGEVDLDGAAKVAAELSVLDAAYGKLDAKSAGATAAVGTGTGGLAGPSGLGALIGAGVALSPVIATLGTGMAGFGAAAYGVIKPITDAAQKTGGLQKNMASLNPEQKIVARGLLDLGKQYDVFSRSLQPEVLGAFDTGLKIAGNVMRDVQPVAKVTGKAFDQFLGQFGATLQDPQWRQFWSFMAATAPQDMRLVSNVLIDLTNDLPALVEGLQPVATGLLKVTDAGARAFTVINKGITDLNHPNTSTGFWSGTLWDKLVGSAQALAGVLPHTSNSILGMAQRSGEASAKLGDLTRSSSLADPPISAMAQGLGGAAARAFDMKNAVAAAAPVTDVLSVSLAGAAVHAFTMKERFGEAAASAGAASPKMVTFAQTTAGAAAQAAAMNLAVSVLTSSLNKMISPILTLEGDQVSFRQAQQAATAAINANKHGLDSNRASALAARTAVIQSTQAAITFAGQEVTVHHNVQAASDILRAQIQYLQTHAGKSRIAAAEIDALRRALRSLPASVRANVDIIGHGRGGISFSDQIAGQKKTGFLEFHAAGGMVGGPPGIDRTPIMASRGEVVVPTHMVSAGVIDHLRGLLPGFAAGGLIGNRSVLDRGIPYVASTGASFEHAAMQQGTRALIAAAVQAAKAAARAAASFGNILGGPGGGAPAANAALARRLFPQWGSGAEWGAWNYLAMRESGWNQYARNPSSGAYGIAQALPPTKYPFAGQAAGGSNPTAQIRWMAAYISGRYGDPIRAAQHEAAFNWYDQGGVMPPGLSLSYNGTGRPEPLVPARGRGGGGVVINMTVNVPVGAHKAEAGKAIAGALDQYFITGGTMRKPRNF